MDFPTKLCILLSKNTSANEITASREYTRVVVRLGSPSSQETIKLMSTMSACFLLLASKLPENSNLSRKKSVFHLLSQSSKPNQRKKHWHTFLSMYHSLHSGSYPSAPAHSLLCRCRFLFFPAILARLASNSVFSLPPLEANCANWPASSLPS